MQEIEVKVRGTGEWGYNRAIKSYQTTPERVEAILLSKDNLDEAALWCGGQAGSTVKASDPSDVAYHVTVPSLHTPFYVHVGEYLVKHLDTGRFSSMSRAEFEKKGFHEVGLRQDGPQLPTKYRGGSVSVPDPNDPVLINKTIPGQGSAKTGFDPSDVLPRDFDGKRPSNHGYYDHNMEWISTND